MTTIIEVLRRHGATFIKDLRALQIQKKKRASGDSARSLNIKELNEDGYKIFGFDYWEKQETGTSPFDLRNVSLADFAVVIEQWARDKNINVNPFNVARSIKFRGDKLFQGQAEPLGAPQLFEASARDLSVKLIESYAVQFRTLIRNSAKR